MRGVAARMRMSIDGAVTAVAVDGDYSGGSASLEEPDARAAATLDARSGERKISTAAAWESPGQRTCTQRRRSSWRGSQTNARGACGSLVLAPLADNMGSARVRLTLPTRTVAERRKWRRDHPRDCSRVVLGGPLGPRQHAVAAVRPGC